MSAQPTSKPWRPLIAVGLLCFAGIDAPPPASAQSPTPEPAPRRTPNRSEDKAPKSAGIRFSRSRGFQTRAFDLTLGPAEVPGEIRYTLDGSAPGAGRGTRYTGPIPIRATTVVRAAVVAADGSVSRPQTHTYLFAADILRQSPDGLPPAGWPYRWGQNLVDYGMDPAVVDDPATSGEMASALRSLPVCSLVLDLADLFDDRRGIYANSSEEGRDWERPASLELIRSEGGKGFQEECGVRIRGGFSSGPFNPKHAFRLFFRKEYGAGKLKYPMFGPGGAQEFDSFDLRCSQNYSWNIGGDARALFVRDQFSRDLQRAMGQPAARGEYVHLILNGQYWGLYNTCERPEASFAATNLGGSKDDYDVVKTGGIGGQGGGMSVGATDGSMEPWVRLVQGARADLSNNAAYFRLLGRKPDGTPDPAQEVLLDPENLVDYLLVIWFGGNLDSPVTRFGGNRAPNNWHAVRNRTTRDGFKFFVWDAEHTLLDPGEDRTGPFPPAERPETSHPQWIFQRCCENAEFRQLVADRIQHHLGEGGALSTPAVLATFRKRTSEIRQAVLCESARWGDVGGGFPFGPGGGERAMRPGPDGQPRPVPRTRDGDWQKEVHRQLEDYLPNRTGIVLFQLWRQGLVSEVPVPEVRQVATGMELSAPAGEVWYTTDGSDPRSVGGEPSVRATRVTGPVSAPQGSRMRLRTRLKSDWSPLEEASVLKPAA